MSEVRGDDQEFFRALEALHMDPFLERIFDEVRGYNALLAEEPVDESDVSSMRDEIDSRWYNVINETVVFTGRLSITRGMDGSKTGPKYYEDVEYIFKGVEPTDDDIRNLNIDDDSPRYYQLNLYMEKTRESGDVDQAMARIEDIASLEFPEKMSPERGRYILANYQPHLLESIDGAFSSPDADESVTAMRLQGIAYSYAEDDEAVDSIVTALNSYTASLIMFDTNIGYGVVANGEAWTVDNEVLPLDNLEAPATVTRVEWRPSPSHGDSIVPHFKLYVSGENLHDAKIPLLVPLDYVSSIYSLRHRFWRDHNKNPSD